MPITQQPNVHLPVGLLEVGDSFFIPTLTTSPYLKQAERMAEARGMTIQHRMGIDTESGLYGMRVLRVS